MTAPATQKLSSSELLARLDALSERLASLEQVTALPFRPGPMLIYKPNERDHSKGGALKLEYRAYPNFNERGYLERQDNGGLFADLAAQTGVSNGNADFNWKRDEAVGTPNELITVKLGMPDILAMLFAYRLLRSDSAATLPDSYRPSRKEGDKWVKETTGKVLGLTHKFDNETTFIELAFADRGTLFRVSKSAKLRRTVSIALHEELLVLRMLERALDAYLNVGLR